MVSRLLEDCPEGWEDFLSPSAINFVRRASVSQAGAKSEKSDDSNSTDGASADVNMQVKRRLVVRNANTLKEVKSQSAISQLKGEGSAVVSCKPHDQSTHQLLQAHRPDSF
jgi:hypothetical protein